MQNILAEVLSRFNILAGLQKPVNLSVVVFNFRKESYIQTRTPAKEESGRNH